MSLAEAWEVWETIPEEEYDGESSGSCLIGYPLWQGQLHDEWMTYLKTGGVVSAPEWFALRFNLDASVIRALYKAVTKFPYMHNKQRALELACYMLADGQDLCGCGNLDCEGC